MPKVKFFDTPELLAQAAAHFFVALAQAAAQQCELSVALSGGQTPRRVYELLASGEFKQQIKWELVHIFLGDERPVSPNHTASNYAMAFAALISQVPILHSNIHPIAGEGNPRKNALDYERALKSYFAGSLWPRFDLVLLGLGEDGHTASLFPGTAATKEKSAWVVANWVGRLNEYRITLTAPAINSAANILFLVSGKNKASRLKEVLSGPSQPEKLPAQLIQPHNGSLTWMVDSAAASQL
jgi:6-phosphogluconolactonase